MSDDYRSKRVKLSDRPSTGSVHVRTNGEISQKASTFLAKLGIKEGETYVEVPEGDDENVFPNGTTKSDRPRDAPFGKDWEEAYFRKMEKLETNLKLVLIKMLAGACNIDISAAVDDSYMDMFRRISEFQNRILQREILATRVDYNKKKLQKDELLKEYNDFIERKAEIGQVVSTNSETIFNDLIDDCIGHVYHRFIYYNVILNRRNMEGDIIQNSSLESQPVEDIALLIYGATDKISSFAMETPTRLKIYTMRFLTSLYRLYLQSPTLARDEKRSLTKDSVVNLMNVGHSISNPRHLDYVAFIPTGNGPDRDDHTQHTARLIQYPTFSDQLKTIYAIVYALILTENLTLPEENRISRFVAYKLIKDLKDVGFKYPDVFIAIQRTLAPHFPDLIQIIEGLRVVCGSRLAFTSNTIKDTNIDLFYYEAENTAADGYPVRMMNVVTTIIFTSCFEYKSSYTGALMAFYMCIFAKIRLETNYGRLKQVENFNINKLGRAEFDLIWDMLDRLSQGELKHPNRFTSPESEAIKRALMEKYSLPIAAIGAVASAPDLASGHHKESYVGLLPKDVQVVLRKFRTTYIGKTGRVLKFKKRKSKKRKQARPRQQPQLPPLPPPPQPPPTPQTPDDGNDDQRERFPSEPKIKEEGVDAIHPYRFLRARKGNDGSDSDSDSSSDSDDDDDDGESDNESAEPFSTARTSKRPFAGRLKTFYESEERKMTAFSDLLDSYDDTIGNLDYEKLDVMFQMDGGRDQVGRPDQDKDEHYIRALEIYDKNHRGAHIDKYVDALVPKQGTPLSASRETLFARSFPIVLFSVLYRRYQEATEKILDSINKNLEVLDRHLADVDRQLIRLAKGEIVADEKTIVDNLLPSPENVLSVIQSGKFIINTKLIVIMNRVHSAIILDPLLEFSKCPLDALTTPLRGSILYSIASLFAEICGTEYNRRNVATGSVTYASKNTVEIQKEELRSSLMSLSFYRWIPGMERQEFEKVRARDPLTGDPLIYDESVYYGKFNGWFIQDSVSSTTTNRRKRKREIKMILSPTATLTVKNL
jgi:hypothetical protein